jgi:hypothetical protein
MMNRNILFSCFYFAFVFIGCHPGNPISNIGDPSTCEGCHISKDALVKLVETDDTGTSDDGGGG